MTHHPAGFRPDEGPQHILDCAVALFAEEGFERPSHRDIAQRAGVAETYVRTLYPTKAAMIEALVEISSAQIADAVAGLTRAAARRDPEAGLRAVLTLLFETITDRELSAATRVVMAEGARFPGLAHHYRARVIDIGHTALAGLIAAGVEQGVFRPVNPDAANRVLIGPAVTQLLMSTVFARADDAPLDARAFANDLADLIFNGLKA
jgi:AcrR family transcriptional regulator